MQTAEVWSAIEGVIEKPTLSLNYYWKFDHEGSGGRKEGRKEGMSDSEFLENISIHTRVAAISTVIEGMFCSRSNSRNDLERVRRKYISETAKLLAQPHYKIVIALTTGLRLTSLEHLNLMILKALNGEPDELDAKVGAMLDEYDIDAPTRALLESTRKLIRGE